MYGQCLRNVGNAGNVGSTISRFATILRKICSLPRPQKFPPMGTIVTINTSKKRLFQPSKALLIARKTLPEKRSKQPRKTSKQPSNPQKRHRNPKSADEPIIITHPALYQRAVFSLPSRSNLMTSLLTSRPPRSELYYCTNEQIRYFKHIIAQKYSIS